MVDLDRVGAVTQLVLRERQSRDQGWYDDMRDTYASASVVDMSWFLGSGHEFVERSRQMSRSTTGWGGHSAHRLSPPTVRLNGDRAWAELPLGIEFRIDIDGVEADLVSYCRNQYRAQRDEGGVWRIVRLTSIYERDTLRAALPGTTLSVNPAEFEAFRPSYRCLAWFHQRIGLDGRDGLLGDDRPDGVAAQYAREFAWLAGTDTSERS